MALRAHNLSQEGVPKLKFVPFYSPCALSDDILFSQSQNVPFLAENHGLYVVHGFNQVSFHTRNSLQEGRCYESEICAILLSLRCAFRCQNENVLFLAENHGL